MPILAGLIIFMVSGALFSLLLLILVSFRKRLAWRIVEAGFRVVKYITRGKIDLAGLKPKARSVLDAFHDGFHLLRAHSWSARALSPINEPKAFVSTGLPDA
jgi:hypothetical protein